MNLALAVRSGSTFIGFDLGFPLSKALDVGRTRSVCAKDSGFQGGQEWIGGLVRLRLVWRYCAGYSALFEHFLLAAVVALKFSRQYC